LKKNRKKNRCAKNACRKSPQYDSQTAAPSPQQQEQTSKKLLVLELGPYVALVVGFLLLVVGEGTHDSWLKQCAVTSLAYCIKILVDGRKLPKQKSQRRKKKRK
jgi:hypothetical protein